MRPDGEVSPRRVGARRSHLRLWRRPQTVTSPSSKKIVCGDLSISIIVQCLTPSSNDHCSLVTSYGPPTQSVSTLIHQDDSSGFFRICCCSTLLLIQAVRSPYSHRPDYTILYYIPQPVLLSSILGEIHTARVPPIMSCIVQRIARWHHWLDVFNLLRSCRTSFPPSLHHLLDPAQLCPRLSSLVSCPDTVLMEHPATFTLGCNLGSLLLVLLAQNSLRL